MTKLKSVCEEKNYEWLYDTHCKTLYNFIYYKCGDPDQASDLVQDAFIKLWKNCSKIIFEKSKSYLFTIAKNQFLKEVAHHKVKLNYTIVGNYDTEVAENPEFLLEEKEYMKTLESAISNLTTAQREVFLLNRIEKKKYKEIAEMLSISVKAVEKRMHLALVKLREDLGRNI